MNTRSFIALAASLVIVASSVALFAQSVRAPAYDISLAPSVIDGLPVENIPPVEVTADAAAVHDAVALRSPETDALPGCTKPHAVASLRQVMPYYSFAHTLTSFSAE